MKKLSLISLILSALLAFPVASYAQLTVAQGGSGLTSVPTNNVLLGSSALHLTSVSTSSLGLESKLTFNSPLSRTANAVSFLFNTLNTWTALNVFSGGASTTQLTVTDRQFFSGITTPAAPGSGTLELYAVTTQGITRPTYQDGCAELSLGRDNVFVAKNLSGITLNPGDVVDINGSTGNVPNVTTVLNTVGGVHPDGVVFSGINSSSITANSFGCIMKTGILSSINTSAFTSGQTLYLSTTTAGAFVNYQPQYPYSNVIIGMVLVSGVGNGSIYVHTSPFIGGLDTGTYQSNWGVGSWAVAGAKSISFSNTLGTTTLSANPTGARAITIPDASGTLCLTTTCVGTVTSVSGAGGISGTVTSSGSLKLVSYLATSTADTANQVAVFTSTNATPATFGGFAGLTFASATNLLTVTNASTTNATASQSLFVASKQVNPYQNATFAYGATSTAWTGTTTETTLVAPFAGTLQDVQCSVPTGTLNVQVKVNSTAVTPMFNASSTVGTITFTGSNTFVRGDILEFDFGTPASSPNLVTCTPRTTVTSF